MPEGAATGIIIWLPFWLLRMLGAGDVKLFAAASAWLGPRLALDASMVTAVVGGVIAVGWIAWSAGVRRARRAAAGDVAAGVAVDVAGVGRDDWVARRSTLPYGVAMAFGLALTAWASHLFH